MLTRCPHCDTYFRITADQLKAAQGDVRCGRCFGTFNGLENLIEDAAEPNESPAPAPPPPIEPPKRPPPKPAKPIAKPAPAPARPKPAPKPVTQSPAPPAAKVDTRPPPAPPAPRPVTTAAPATPSAAPLQQIPFPSPRSQELLEQIESDAEHAPSRLRHFAWAVLAAVLCVVLAGQYAYFNREQLAQVPSARPWLAFLCMALQCEVPLRHAPTMITLVDRKIAADPEHEHSLLVTASFTNDAPFQQRFPVLQLTFWDVSNRVIASRRFTPSEYLTGNIDISKGIASQQTVAIRLRLKDPGESAVSFEFEFL